MDSITPASSSLSGIVPSSVVSTGSVGASAGTSSGSASASSAASATDQVQISIKGALATKYVQEVRAVAPLDQQTVNQLKAAIAKGNYPPPSLIEGLINLVGATISSSTASADPTAAAPSDSSDSSS